MSDTYASGCDMSGGPRKSSQRNGRLWQISGCGSKHCSNWCRKPAFAFGWAGFCIKDTSCGNGGFAQGSNISCIIPLEVWRCLLQLATPGGDGRRRKRDAIQKSWVSLAQYAAVLIIPWRLPQSADRRIQLSFLNVSWMS